MERIDPKLQLSVLDSNVCQRASKPHVKGKIRELLPPQSVGPPSPSTRGAHELADLGVGPTEVSPVGPTEVSPVGPTEGSPVGPTEGSAVGPTEGSPVVLDSERAQTRKLSVLKGPG